MVCSESQTKTPQVGETRPEHRRLDLMQQVPAAILLVVRTLLRCNMHEQKERERGRRVAGGQTTTPRWRSRSRLQQLCIDGPLLCNLLGGGEVTITPSWLNSKASIQGFKPNCPAKFNLMQVTRDLWCSNWARDHLRPSAWFTVHSKSMR